MDKKFGGVIFSFQPKLAADAPGGGGGGAKGKRAEAESSKCDTVTQDRIWKQAVGKEEMCLKNWNDNWGFLTEFDAKGEGITMAGNHKEPEPLPEKMSIFSDEVPNTNSGNYGSRVNSDVGATMQQLEFKFYSGKRRKKMGNDLVCY
ncbi:uncharacterized protein C2orf50-like isoform X3 [Mizuhopecten yessoensis]|uniref:uncharacterized protein C2orf50-like isoform X3 n=1 Tax=Mizuhopecten yessoensis TaxID=6573 RepID=UPI000B45E4D6|nr:uncharacterized protein C2orf50-like isoform X3 [Mizuhopecten yessoensis]